MSVQSPTSVMSSICSFLFSSCSNSPSFSEPNVTLSIASASRSASSCGQISQPFVPLMQCGTGRCFPSCVSKYRSPCVSRVKITFPGNSRIFCSTFGTMATASGVPSAPSIKSFCMSTTINIFCIFSPPSETSRVSRALFPLSDPQGTSFSRISSVFRSPRVSRALFSFLDPFFLFFRVSRSFFPLSDPQGTSFSRISSVFSLFAGLTVSFFSSRPAG